MDMHAKMWFVKFSWMSNTITRFLASCSVVDLSKVEIEVAFLHPVQNVIKSLRYMLSCWTGMTVYHLHSSNMKSHETL